MPRPKPDVKPVPIMVRVHPDTAAWINGQRGAASRSDFVNGILLRAIEIEVGRAKALADIERLMVLSNQQSPPTDPNLRPLTRKQADILAKDPHGLDGVQIGPQRVAPGALLKKR